MSLADQIRDFIEKRYLVPAKKAGNQRVTVNAGDVHREMGLQSRFPAVCSAMRSGDLLERSRVTLEKWDGPSQGSAVNVTYSFSPNLLAAGEAQATTAAPNVPTAASVDWSSEIPLERKTIESAIPHKPGVYRILQQKEYARYEGRTRILKIGMSENSLQQELLNHLSVHAAANRLARLRQAGSTITVSFAILPRDLALQQEAALLRAFEDEHWDLPMLNGQRGYGRGTDAHYRT